MTNGGEFVATDTTIWLMKGWWLWIRVRFERFGCEDMDRTVVRDDVMEHYDAL